MNKEGTIFIDECSSHGDLKYICNHDLKERKIKRNDIRVGNALKKSKLKSIVCELIK